MIAIINHTKAKPFLNMSSINWLRTLREQIGIDTQEELAARLQLEGFSVTRAAVSHWENDRYKPPLDDPDFRKALTRILDISEIELLRHAGFEVKTKDHTEEGETAAHLVDRLSEKNRKLALKLLRQLEN